MALPKRKVSKGRRNRRRSHDSIKLATLISCDKCGEAKLPHIMCPSCRTYNGRQILPNYDEA